MKKIAFMKLPCQLFAMATVLLFYSCDNRNDLPVDGNVTGTDVDSALGSKYILASSLALAAEIGKSEPDPTAIKALHRTSRDETAEATSTSTYNLISCCCPCYQTFDVEIISAVQPTDDAPSSTDTTIMDPQRTTMRDSTGHCPCPSAMEIIAKNVERMSAVVDGRKVPSEKQTGKLEGWTVFKIDEKTLTPGKHTLKFEGAFFGKESREYEIPLLIDKNKPYFFYK